MHIYRMELIGKMHLRLNYEAASTQIRMGIQIVRWKMGLVSRTIIMKIVVSVLLFLLFGKS